MSVFFIEGTGCYIKTTVLYVDKTEDKRVKCLQERIGNTMEALPPIAIFRCPKLDLLDFVLLLPLFEDRKSFLGSFDTRKGHRTESRSHAVGTVNLAQLHTAND